MALPLDVAPLVLGAQQVDALRAGLRGGRRLAAAASVRPVHTSGLLHKHKQNSQNAPKTEAEG